MKQILKYPGGKWRISEWIISHFPEHKVYCEPFFGSGAIFFRKKPSYLETINDIDGDIVNLFKVCRDYPEKLASAINLTPFSREEFQNCYDTSDGDHIERARRTLVRYHQSFGTSNSTRNTWKNTQTPGGPRCATMWNYLPDVIVKCCERLKNAQIENINAIELIKRYDDKDVLIYCDPPYLPELRKKNLYACEMSVDEHLELLGVLKRSKSKIILSGYDSELYSEQLSDWISFKKTTTAQMGLHRIEKIWCNFNYQNSLF